MPSYSPNTAMRSHLDNQIGVMAELTRKSYDVARRLSDLNLDLTRDLFEDFYRVSRQMVSSGDPMQLSSLMARQLQPFGERLRIYTQQVGGILSGAHLDLTRATEHIMPEASRAAQAFAASATPADFARGLFGARHNDDGAAGSAHRSSS